MKCTRSPAHPRTHQLTPPGNNSQTNNIFLGDADTPIMMDFGTPGQASTSPCYCTSLHRCTHKPHTHARTQARTHTHAHTGTHAHTHKHTHAQTHTHMHT